MYSGIFFWDKIGSEKIYSITAYFCMDIFGLVVFILANTKFLKGAGCLGMALGSYFFYMEFDDPYNWEVANYKGLATLVLMTINLFFVWYYTDLFKNLKK